MNKKITSLAAALISATAFCGLCTGCASNIATNKTDVRNPEILASTDETTPAAAHKVILSPGWYVSGGIQTNNAVDGTDVTEADGDTYFVDNAYVCNLAAGEDLPEATTTRDGMTFVGWRYASEGEIITVAKMPDVTKLESDLYLYAEWATSGDIDPDDPDNPDIPDTGNKIMSIGGSLADVEFTKKTSGMPANQEGEYFAENVSLTQGNVLSFKINGANVNLEVESGVTAVTGSGSSVTVAATGTYTVSVKKWNDNQNWIIWVGVPVSTDNNYGAVSGSTAYLVGKFSGKNAAYSFDSGYEMKKNPSNANEWMIAGLQLAAGDTFRIRLGASDSVGYNKVKGGVSKSLYSMDGDKIVITAAGTYSFYYDPTNTTDPGIWIAKD